MPSVTLSERQKHSKTCTHTGETREVSYSERVCPECVSAGDSWVHLRICMSCGHVGCCDSSKNRHATRHFEHSGHPIVKTIEDEPDWAWCYRDEILLK